MPEPVSLKGRPYLLMGCAGRNVSSYSMFSLYPYARIQQELSSLRHTFLTFGLLNIFFSIFLVRSMTQRFLEPIRVLHQGTEFLRRREFSERLPDLGEDEFGRIGQALNSALESLEELAVARIVQDNLFPVGTFETENFRVYGKSVPMSELGGDFFDILSGGNGQFALALGDVTGHGVPAALHMAMAKAVTFRVFSQGEPLRNALTAMNRLFLAIRGRGPFRSMTFQVVEGREAGSELVFTNAGHCYPIHLKKDSADFIKAPATPVGISVRPVFTTVSIELKAGEALLLYTDGAAEATNPEGQNLGFERLATLALRQYDPDPQVFYDRLYRSIRDFTGHTADHQDDLTMLIIVRRDPSGRDSANRP